MTDTIIARFHVAYPGFNLDMDLQIPAKGVTAFFGQSGSGKTTALRCMAGLERGYCGYLEVAGEVWQDDSRGIFLPTHKRPLGYVFQESSLFPHLDIRRNLKYGQKRVPGSEHKVSLDQAVALLGIDHLLSRMPDRLSGGERQRAAIARALLLSPRLLLMDEPMAALDLKLKREIMPYLERLRDELDIPVVYVSHSPDEVANLADQLVLMEKGQVLASGPLVELMTRLDLPLAHGDSAEAVILTTVEDHEIEHHLSCASFPGGKLILPYHDLEIGQKVRVRVLARDVSLALEAQKQTSILNILPAVVEGMMDDGPGQIMVRLSMSGVSLLSRITAKSAKALGIQSGTKVYAQIKGVALLK